MQLMDVLFMCYRAGWVLKSVMLVAVISVMTMTASAQNQGIKNTSPEQLEAFAERLKRLEDHLGVSSETDESSMDAMMRRLEQLEKQVYQPDKEAQPPEDDVLTPPPEGMEDIEWKAWDGGGVEANISQEDLTGQSYGDAIALGYNTTNAVRNFEIKQPLTFSGYGVASYFYDDKQAISTFEANAIELDLTASLSRWVIFGADIDFLNEGMDPVFPPFRHPSFDNNNTTNIYDTGGFNDDDDDLFIEQLFVKARLSEDAQLLAGKFNVPTGLEGRDPNQRYAVMPSLLFPLWPRDLTGLRLTYQINDQWSVSPYVFNGWDNDQNINDNFLFATYSEFFFNDDTSIAGTVAYGAPFPDNNSDDALLLDLELRYSGIEKLWMGLEFMYATTEVDRLLPTASFDDAQYYGALALGNYRFTDLFGLTLQSSFATDDDGLLWGNPQDRWEFSVIPTVYFNENVELRFQYQHIEASSGMFNIFQPVNEQTVLTDNNDLLMISLIWSY